ncbi:MAG: PilN domain-containing protein [Gemmatimonadota bacterium]
MSEVAGIELSLDVVRAVTLGAWRKAPGKTVVLPWNPARPADAVAALRDALGPTRRIALSIGLGFLHVKQARLPPAPHAERRRILSFEPDRFFPVQDQSLAVSLANDDNLAFAIDADQLERWIAALEEWSPVEIVEPAPLSIARALGKDATGTFAIPAAAAEHGVIELQNGRLRSARRIPGDAQVQAQSLPPRAGISAEHLAAYGAALGVNESLDTMLLTDPLASRVRGRRLRRVSLAAVLCVAAFALAVWAVDRSRERTLDRIRQEITALTPNAREALDLSERLSATDRESSAIVVLSDQRSDPLPVLAALSAQLPPGVTVLNIRSNGGEWQIEGRARDAAAIIPLLDRDDRFEAVRFLSASTRFREGDRMYETFSIAFRVRAAT